MARWTGGEEEFKFPNDRSVELSCQIKKKNSSTKPIAPFLPIDHDLELTFFSVSIHLVMAGTEDPVRSLRARIASLMRAMVAILMMGWGV